MKNPLPITEKVDGCTGLKHIPIVMLSAIVRKTFFHTISRLHFGEEESPPAPEAYMEKPPDAGELATLISSLLK